MKYISLILDGRIHTSEPSECACTYSNEDELAHLLAALIDEDFLLVDELSGWPPAALARSLQEKGLLNKSFTAVAWQGQGKHRTFQVMQRCLQQFERMPKND